MNDRPITDSNRRWLDGELEAWSQAGLIAPDQALGIRTCYEPLAKSGHRKQDQARFAVQGLAALMVGLALLLLIGYNWEALHWGAKLAMIFGVVAGTHAAAFYLRTNTAAQRSSELLFFLGCLFYGAGIWLVAQVFHLDSHYPDGVWWWAVGVLPFAICLDTILLHALLVGLLGLWAGMEVLNFAHLSPFWFWSWWPNGAYSLPLLAAPGFVWAYRRGALATLGLYVALLAWWIVLQAFAWRLEWQSIYLVGLVGAMFFVIAENHRHGSRMAIPYRAYGVLMLGGALIPASFYSFQQEIGREWNYRSTSAPAFVQLILFGVVIAALVAFTFLLRPLGAGGDARPFARLQELLKRQWIPFAFVAAMAALATIGVTPGFSPLLPTVIANVAMLGFAIWIMQLGLREERGRLFTAGVLYFLLWTILRYADLFGQYGGMLGAALMFFLCGAALWGLASVWGKRKEIVHGR